MMIPSKMISSLLLATFCTVCLAEYGSDYDNSYNGGYRVEPERHEYEEPQYHHEAPMERSHSPTSDSNSYHLYHRDHPQADSHVQLDHPQNHHEPKHHDHGTSSMSFYQKVKHHEHKFKFEQKHGKHGNFHGYAHPYAYGGLKVHDW
ncbi:hypothetical protein GE061_019757 [Apolygus lucorum]|uniref:Histidine-rich glycoprotein-like n=1 Tax=Apolygus lucorum TaxID=248454 RepID=A0A6A4JHS5_APOLU|nr:hypothetical protein GE061_019757 [Apolygus lucorum]